MQGQSLITSQQQTYALPVSKQQLLWENILPDKVLLLSMMLTAWKTSDQL